VKTKFGNFNGVVIAARMICSYLWDAMKNQTRGAVKMPIAQNKGNKG
jgi:hypothetical protein